MAAPHDRATRILAEEDAFRRWYAERVRRTARPGFSLDPDPDAPEHHYDYRAAFRAGAEPALDESDWLYHWPSEFKADDHPRRFLPVGKGGAMVDTRKDETMPKPKKTDGTKERERLMARENLRRLQNQATSALHTGDVMAATDAAIRRERERNPFGRPEPQRVPTGRAPDPMTAEAYRTPAGASPLSGDYLSRGHVDAAQAAAEQRRRQQIGSQLSASQIQALEHLEREATLWRSMDEGGTVRPRATRSPLMDDMPLPSEQAWLDAQEAEARQRKIDAAERKRPKKKQRESALAKFGRMV